MRDAGNRAVVCVALHEAIMGAASPPADGKMLFSKRRSEGSENSWEEIADGTWKELRLKIVLRKTEQVQRDVKVQLHPGDKSGDGCGGKSPVRQFSLMRISHVLS